VAIIGRPNVGKSSIFNRLAGRRIAIVHEEPGITRDRIICTVCGKNTTYDLVDTGGIEDAETYSNSGTLKNQTIDTAVRQQVNLALSEAQAVIFVVDARRGITPADEKAASLLHKSGLQVLLAANKTDSVELELHVHEFDKFGFSVFPVSALNNRGFEDLTGRLDQMLPPGTSKDIPRLRVAVVGRPNVGKSMLVNRLTRSERVIVSSEPGTTRDSIDIPLTTKSGEIDSGYILTDTAGLRHSKKIKFAVDSFSQIRTRETISNSDVVLLVIDATMGPTAYDKNIAAYILENNKPCVLVVNKWDLVSNAFLPTCRSALYEAMPFLDFAPVICASAATGFNTGKVIETVNYVAGQNRKNISTSILNRGLEKAVARFQPPVIMGGHLKIFYATQTAIEPITFLLFVNDPAKLSASYERYLISSIRKSLGFEGVPIVLKYKKRHRKDQINRPT
jgi:GTP-binding protein